MVEDKDKGWSKVLHTVGKIDDSYTVVGLFSDDPAPGDDPGTEVVARGVLHQFGSEKTNLPARPWMTQGWDDYLEELERFIAERYILAMAGILPIDKALAQIGEWYAGKLKLAITEGNFAPLKPATIARKKSSKPLIDTAQMRNSITHKEVL